MDEPNKTIFILGGSSDIGLDLAERYLSAGCRVVATFRSLENTLSLEGREGLTLLQCDIGDRESVSLMLKRIRSLGIRWDVFISSVGTLEPIGPFFECDFDAWEESVSINSLSQLRVLHGLYPLRREGEIVHAAFFAGGGTNSALTNYSAYCIAKIKLIKMCELLDDEAPDLNVFIIGPGFVNTKIHQATLGAGERAGPGLKKVQDFLESPGTSYDDIHENINWCIEHGREVSGGRNFSTVNDSWKDGGPKLVSRLKKKKDMFKLRRHEGKGKE
jgi:NAD(P)-dependent dehydrogenase (short-subunit alcohol dehydrogenase family)